MSRARRIRLCPQCSEPLILAPYIVCCSDPTCSYLISSASSEPGSNADVKLASLMVTPNHEGIFKCHNSLAVGQQ